MLCRKEEIVDGTVPRVPHLEESHEACDLPKRVGVELAGGGDSVGGVGDLLRRSGYANEPIGLFREFGRPAFDHMAHERDENLTLFLSQKPLNELNRKSCDAKGV